MCLVCYPNRGRIIGISSMSLKCAANITMRHARHVALEGRVDGVLKVAETTPHSGKEKERRYVVDWDTKIKFLFELCINQTL